jgi:UDP-N-acetyl-2-amino-2-deoxyglucuronate dehydrogenase
MRPLGIGVIGCGAIAPAHAEAVSGATAARLVGFLGRSAGPARCLGERYGVPWTTEREAFLATPGLEAVLIGTPSGTHAELGIAAAGAGKHVLVEKPIDVSLERARALVDACRGAGVTLGVVYQSRFVPDVELLQQALAGGLLGRLCLVDAHVKWWREPTYYSSSTWRGSLALDGGGALINQAIHTVDLVQLLAGPVAAVTGHTQRSRHGDIEGEDTALALVRYASGACGVIEATTAAAPGFARRIELSGTGGSVILEGDAIRTWHLTDGESPQATAARAIDGAAADPRVADARLHRLVVEDFVTAVSQRRAPRVDGAEGLKSLEIVLAIYESARSGRKVSLAQG